MLLEGQPLIVTGLLGYWINRHKKVLSWQLVFMNEEDSGALHAHLHQ